MTDAFIHPLPMNTMLWSFKLNAYSGYLDAEPNITEARKALIAKIVADPGALIGKLEPAEPTPHNLLALGKRVFGLNP